MSIFNPARFLSTDDPLKDQLQIMAEQWDREEEWLIGQEPLSPDEYPTELYYEHPGYIQAYCGCSSCTFWRLIWIEDVLESVKEQNAVWRRNHAVTDCKDELVFGII